MKRFALSIVILFCCGALSACTLGGGNINLNPSVRVVFNTDGGSAVATQTITKGGVALQPAAVPTKTGYVFVNWFADAEFNFYYNFASPILADTTIYAKWAPISYIVNYDCNRPFGSYSGITAPSTHSYDETSRLTENGFSVPFKAYAKSRSLK